MWHALLHPSSYVPLALFAIWRDYQYVTEKKKYKIEGNKNNCQINEEITKKLQY